MRTILDPVSEPAHDAFVEKKSEFIGDVAHIDSLDEALAFVGHHKVYLLVAVGMGHHHLGKHVRVGAFTLVIDILRAGR